MKLNLIKIISGSMVVAMIISRGTLGADAIDVHPNHDDLNRIFKTPAPAGFQQTGITRSKYLKLIAGNVDFFLKCQDKSGAIIDPVSKGERQYSTPAFAVAAGLLVKESGRQDLLEPATRAMTFALNALVNKTPADSHADFYIPMLVHAYRQLKDVAPSETVKQWELTFKKINPETMYRADLKGMNWNVVSSCGELLRRHEGLVSDDMKDAQMKYLESCLKGHLDRLTPLGLFDDPGAPMAYDAFTRLWLEDVYADDAYDGAQSKVIGDFLLQGGLSSLLLLSPSGEWIMGGRSALHNWTDLQTTAICEINATYWKKQGRDDVAGAFKRAAHLAFDSAARWQRPTGELNIIKNRAEPEKRFAYERYSNHSQYNLLPMAMLAIAYARADESIVEKPSPSEAGGYVLDARETFHKIVASAGGYYVAIDTAADDHYNATGLQRVHRTGVKFPSISDSSPHDRAYGPADAPKSAIAPGLQWKTENGQWLGLADFAGGKVEHSIKSADLKSIQNEEGKTSFEIVYTLAGPGGDGKIVTEQYVITINGVSLTATFSGDAAGYRVQIPVLVNDGANEITPQIAGTGITIVNQGSTTSFDIPGASGAIKLEDQRVLNHNGYIQRAIVPLQNGTAQINIQLKE